MRQGERDKVVMQIAELRAMLRTAQSADMRETLQLALADCERRLADLDSGRLNEAAAKGLA
jgi:hypothetical protein